VAFVIETQQELDAVHLAIQTGRTGYVARDEGFEMPAGESFQLNILTRTYKIGDTITIRKTEEYHVHPEN
jgi:hypothetical protein